MKKRNFLIPLALAVAFTSGCEKRDEPEVTPDVKITTSTFSSKSVVVNNGYSIGDTSIEKNANGTYTVTFNIQPPETKQSS